MGLSHRRQPIEWTLHQLGQVAAGMASAHPFQAPCRRSDRIPMAG